MAVNPYFYEKMVADRHAEIRRGVQQSRLAVHTEQRPAFAQRLAGGFNSLLAKRSAQPACQQSRAYLQES